MATPDSCGRLRHDKRSGRSKVTVFPRTEERAAQLGALLAPAIGGDLLSVRWGVAAD